MYFKKFLPLLLFIQPLTAATFIPYELNATLDNGGVLTGTFVLDLDSTPTSSSATQSTFEISNFNIIATNTALFLDSVDGTVSDLSLSQNSSNNTQTLLLDFTANDGNSGAFGEITFSAFAGVNNVLSEIEGSFTQGFLDGNGSPSFVSAEATVIPEPSTTLVLGLGAFSLLFARKR